MGLETGPGTCKSFLQQAKAKKYDIEPGTETFQEVLNFGRKGRRGEGEEANANANANQGQALVNHGEGAVVMQKEERPDPAKASGCQEIVLGPPGHKSPACASRYHTRYSPEDIGSSPASLLLSPTTGIQRHTYSP